MAQGSDLSGEVSISLFDDMTLCTDEQVEHMIPLVPEPRRNQALKFRHTFGRFACLKSYLMLSGLLESRFGITDFKISIAEHGKPYLADYPNVHFSISHCQKAIAVGVSGNPVGIDVEGFRHFNETLLDKTMNATQKADIIASQSPEQTFAAYWTRKEAVFKLLGTGITDNLHDILTDKTKTDTTLNLDKGYAVSVAVFNR